MRMDEREARQSPNTNSVFSDQEATEEVIRPLGGSVLKHHSNTYCPSSSRPSVLRVVTHTVTHMVKGHMQALENAWWHRLSVDLAILSPWPPVRVETCETRWEMKCWPRPSLWWDQTHLTLTPCMYNWTWHMWQLTLSYIGSMVCGLITKWDAPSPAKIVNQKQ